MENSHPIKDGQVEHVVCHAFISNLLELLVGGELISSTKDKLFFRIQNYLQIKKTVIDIPGHHQQHTIWKRMDGKAVLIATNQTGSVVWCIDRQKVASYRTGVKENSPAGMTF